MDKFVFYYKETYSDIVESAPTRERALEKDWCEVNVRAVMEACVSQSPLPGTIGFYDFSGDHSKPIVTSVYDMDDEAILEW